ncbi:MAG TPA: hypothetical protein DDW33_05195 [Ktedonobacter sp.]|nr:hypothetical protein [Ktedonobacter sp.]HAT46250.1 hypothetical protein [Ktedonobacter sp.]HBE25067.1 hypothetical protein [Ktedonobacter sp.]HBE27313.1 hypothetical protein [Ktedonobacter sp.]HCF87329.1 hypothetical protein [Ktedonobacter sp.]
MRGVRILLITIKVKQNIFINVPAKEIFAYISNFENMVDWSSTIITVRKISSGAVEMGATVRSTIRFLGKWLDITFEIVEYEPGRYLTIKSVSGIAPFLFCYQFEPVEDGGTTISQKAVIHLPEGILEMKAPVITSAVRRQIEYDLQTLKDMLEA